MLASCEDDSQGKSLIATTSTTAEIKKQKYSKIITQTYWSILPVFVLNWKFAIEKKRKNSGKGCFY